MYAGPLQAVVHARLTLPVANEAHQTVCVSRALLDVFGQVDAFLLDALRSTTAWQGTGMPPAHAPPVAPLHGAAWPRACSPGPVTTPDHPVRLGFRITGWTSPTRDRLAAVVWERVCRLHRAALRVCIRDEDGPGVELVPHLPDVGGQRDVLGAVVRPLACHERCNVPCRLQGQTGPSHPSTSAK